MLYVALINIITKSNLGTNGVYLILRVTVHYQGKPSQELKTEVGDGTTEKHCLLIYTQAYG